MTKRVKRMKALKMYDYDFSFDVDGERIRRRMLSPTIHNVIQTTRKEFPDARTFIVIEKVLSYPSSMSTQQSLRP